MGAKQATTTSFNLPDGREVTLETGKLATQAHGSCVVKCGDTMLFASVVSKKEARPDAPYFPLYVDYQEKFAANGKIPGNFFRREARLNDYEVLTSRLVDRAIRPLFPENYMNETQVVINLISGEEETVPDAFAALATSTAFAVSDIPFDGPISEVRVAKYEGEYVVNPSRTVMEAADLEIIVAAGMDNVMMVEGEANECSEKELIEAIRTGHDAIKTQIQAQLDLAQKVGEKALNKREVEPVEENEEIKSFVAQHCEERISEIAHTPLAKFERSDAFSECKDAMIEKLEEKKGEDFTDEDKNHAETYFGKLQKEIIRKMVLTEKTRLDGRKPNEVRDIWTEVNYLPSAHGSAIFTRGETQALMSLTLGSKQDEMLIDQALVNKNEDFILHYNFPAFSVGEARMNRGPGRREKGHANLAGRSLRKILPEEQPYTLRLVSDILESNGSSSMATVCSGSMALMDSGLKVSKAVGGIAMGMISEGDDYVILSDILGDEDHLGDMDFKLAGTKDGITACQMDIKIDGLSYDVLEEALEQAREGRLHIISEMDKTISEPREDYKPHAPRIVEMVIDKEFIGAVIGPGGKIIQEMQEETGTTISIEEVDEKGVVNISSNDKEAIQAAVDRIKEITFKPTVGDVYDAVVETVKPYGVFVGFKGNNSGLVHISEISHSHIKDVSDVFSEGDAIKVKFIGLDKKHGKMKLSRKATLPNPEENE